MIINVAGAGAGKTTLMADLITKKQVPEGKVVFCVAFTNAAVENIVKKVVKKLARVPDNIKISTIHSFLYRELITPYYYFLYEKHYKEVSFINLPDNNSYKNAKLTELEAKNILHGTKIPERAKWVVYQKSGDRKPVKDLRKKILSRFCEYCTAIYVDEAQDIDEDMKRILETLDNAGIEITLYGDPKQDVKGLGFFRKMIDSSPTNVDYIHVSYRCPKKHLNLSNTLAPNEEYQTANKDNANGGIGIVFESDIDNVQEFLDSGDFELKYISRKQERFATHKRQAEEKRFETLRYEVQRAVAKKWKGRRTEFEINRMAFYVTEQMLEEFESGREPREIIRKFVNFEAFDKLENNKYVQMISAFHKEDSASAYIPIVRTIESVKGLEAEKCLFILSPDLAPYLIGEKTEDNKTKHLLYVALTRSLDHLTVLVMKEVEEKYTRTKIKSFFEKFTE